MPKVTPENNGPNKEDSQYSPAKKWLMHSKHIPICANQIHEKTNLGDDSMSGIISPDELKALHISRDSLGVFGMQSVTDGSLQNTKYRPVYNSSPFNENNVPHIHSGGLFPRIVTPNLFEMPLE
jgi:hypothetical protein